MHEQPDHARRGFLRGLASLPLIGGGVTILGNPTRAAEPVTLDLLDNYNTWLTCEQRRLVEEIAGVGRSGYFAINNPAWFYHWEQFGKPPLPAPSTRAAIVLSAVGCDWREGRT